MHMNIRISKLRKTNISGMCNVYAIEVDVV